MTPENGLGQKEGQNSSLQVTRCFFGCYCVWTLWEHWKDSMEKNALYSPFKNSPKACGSEVSLLLRFPQKFQVSSFNHPFIKHPNKQTNRPISTPGCSIGAPSKFQAPNDGFYGVPPSVFQTWLLFKRMISVARSVKYTWQGAFCGGEGVLRSLWGLNNCCLVGGFSPTHLKKMRTANWIMKPQFSGWK